MRIKPAETAWWPITSAWQRRGGVPGGGILRCGIPLGIQHIHYHEDGTYEGVQLHFDDDRLIPGFQKLTDACHKHGCKVSIQFQHAGPWNPTGLLPKDMSIREIKCASAMTEEELPGPDFLPLPGDDQG